MRVRARLGRSHAYRGLLVNEEERADMLAHWPAVPPAWLAANNSAIARFDARTTGEAKLEELAQKEGKVPQPERLRSSPETKWYRFPHRA